MTSCMSLIIMNSRIDCSSLDQLQTDYSPKLINSC